LHKLGQEIVQFANPLRRTIRIQLQAKQFPVVIAYIGIYWHARTKHSGAFFVNTWLGGNRGTLFIDCLKTFKMNRQTAVVTPQVSNAR